MYKIVEEKKLIEEQEYTAYGICYDDGHCISDVSSDKTDAEQLADDCNKYDLDPIHLYDIVEDFLVR